jgi:pyocin large subunit-like protein
MWNNLILLSMAAIITMETSTSVKASQNQEKSQQHWQAAAADFCRTIEDHCKRANDPVNHPVPNETPIATTLCQDVARFCAEKLEQNKQGK